MAGQLVGFYAIISIMVSYTVLLNGNNNDNNDQPLLGGQSLLW
jgi:hypothetical protein